MSEWKKVKLGDLATKITKGTTPSNIGESFCDRGIPFIRSELITQNKYISDVGLLYISKETHEKLKRSQLEANDILFSMAGVYLGKTAILRECDVPANTNQAVALIRLDSVLCNVDYIYYYLNQESVIRYVNQISGQAAQPNINLQQIGEISIVIPSRKEQDNIATILSRYDTLIENYQKQIKLLEEAAQRFYKEWFVDLRFPGHEDVKMVDGLPEGWEKKKMADICDTIGGGTPSTKNVSYYEGGTINWVTPTDITRNNSLCLLDTEKKITKEGLNHSSAKMLPPETILMTSRASVGFFGICDFEVCTNQGFISCVPIEKDFQMYLLYNLMNRVEEIRRKAGGSTYLEISKSVFRNFDIICPDNHIVSLFQKEAHRILENIRSISRQIRLLTEARDRLLPRLMEGKMEVDAPKGQRATSIEQRSGHNEQTTNAPKGQKH